MILLNISEHVNLYSKHSNEFSKRHSYLIHVLLQNTDLVFTFMKFYLLAGEAVRNYDTYIRRLLLAVL